MRILIAAFLFFSILAWGDSQPPSPSGFVGSQHEQGETTHSQDGATNEKGGSDKSPLFVEQVKSPEEKRQSADEATYKDNETTWNRYYQIATFVMAFFTIVLAFVTAAMWWSGKETAKTQLRAYLTVVHGGAIYQDETNTFGVSPRVINSGQTPAYKVRYWARAAVFPTPLPDTAVMGIAENDPILSEGILGAGHDFVLSAFCGHRFPEGEIIEIRMGLQRRIYIWGRVTYNDVFGREWFTDFCISSWWPIDHKGVWIPGSNGAPVVASNYHKKYSNAT